MATVSTRISNGTYILTYNVTSTATVTTVTFTRIQYSESTSDGLNYAYTVAIDVRYPYTELSWTTFAKGTKTKDISISKTISWNRGSTSASKGMIFVVSMTRVSDQTEFRESANFTITVPALPTYTNTYKANGGTGSDQTQTHQHGVSFAAKPANTFSRTNYVFKNWNSAANGSGSQYTAGSTYTYNANLTLYAQWYAPYTVSYNANGGSGAPGNQTKIYNQALTLQTAKPTRTNYVFKEWTTAADGTGSHYSPGGSYTANANATLYAQWYAPYTVSYNANGGTGAPGNQVKIYNQTLTLSSTAPTRDNYTFVDWTTASNGSGTHYSSGGSYATNANLTLYAQWSQHYASPSLTVDNVYRCDSNGKVDDEGTYAAFECSFRIWNTSTQNSCQVSASVGAYNEHTSNFYASDTSGGWTEFTAKIIVNAYLETDLSYASEVTVTDTQGGGNSGISGRTTRSDTVNATIANAFYTIDILGDKYLYNLSTDTTVDPEKTYYTRSGTGFSGDPFVYTVVTPESGANPSAAEYFEANGPRPAHGVAFGTPAKKEGFCVAMPVEFESTVTLGNGSESADTIKYRGPYSTDEMIRFLPNDDPNTYGPGSGLSMGGGGLVVIGSGESAENYRVAEALPPGTESMHIASDNDITLAPGCQTVANRAYVKASSTAYYYPVLTLKSGPSHVAAVNTTSNNDYSNSIYLARIAFQSKNGVESGSIGNMTENGAVRSYLAARNEKTDGTFVENWLSLFVNKDGSRSYTVSDSTAFRKAIGANTSGYWPVSVGGTGISDLGAITTKMGDTTSAASGSWVRLQTTTIASGKYIALVGVYTANNTTGGRQYKLTTEASPSSPSFVTSGGVSLVRSPSPSGWALYDTMSAFVSVSSSTTYYVYGYHTSGSALNMRSYVCFVKIG